MPAAHALPECEKGAFSPLLPSGQFTPEDISASMKAATRAYSILPMDQNKVSPELSSTPSLSVTT